MLRWGGMLEYKDNKKHVFGKKTCKEAEDGALITGLILRTSLQTGEITV